MTIVDTAALSNNELTVQQNQTETKKLNTVTLNCEAWGVRPDSTYSRNVPRFKLLTDTLKWPYEEIPWVATGP